MASPHENSGFPIQPIEYPESPNHFSEVHSPNHLPEVLQYKPTPDPGVTYPSGLSQQYLHPQSRNPFNLSPLAFGALISLLTALIVGAALGGGLGAALSKREECGTTSSAIASTGSLETQAPTPASTSSPSTSATSSALIDYAAPEPSLVQSLHINCPELDGTTIEDALSNPYEVQCGHRIVESSETVLYDALIAYSLEDCIQACLDFSSYQTQIPCTAVSWCQSLSYCADTVEGANCWLFNSSSSMELNDNYTAATYQGSSQVFGASM
ncbi:hypothetical protein F5Y05DRAFT_22434 [Hypoxylon sp. FL0543]|nr:hypothetical protein F5Y05DRAFT_22434 [Hypoxylon sp. FL0543]